MGRMAELVDLRPAAADMKLVLAGIKPDALQLQTPCTEFTVSDLMSHCQDAAGILTAAATRDSRDPAASSPEHDGSVDNVAADLAADIDLLARAWGDPALSGLETTTAGGMTMPVHFHNMIAVQELILHAWDLAAATGQDFDPDPATLGKLHSFLTDVAADAPRDGSAPFGPAVTVASDAPVLDEVLGMSGRDPTWQPR